MHDLPKLQALVPQGRADGEARLRAVRAWPSMEIYRTADDVRPAHPSPCGRDCGPCEVAGTEAGTQCMNGPAVFADLPRLLEAGLRDLSKSTLQVRSTNEPEKGE